jgi:hypothetical protein
MFILMLQKNFKVPFRAYVPAYGASNTSDGCHSTDPRWILSPEHVSEGVLRMKAHVERSKRKKTSKIERKTINLNSD